MTGRSPLLRRWVVGAIIALVSLAAIATPRPALAASVSTDVISVATGGRLTVSGSGFSGGETVVSWASSARGSVYATESASADSNGNVRFQVTIRRFWEPGWWAVTLQGLSSGRQAIATYQVTTSPPDGVLDISSTTASAGTRVNFHGAGFSNDETVTVWGTHPDGTAFELPKEPGRNGADVYFFYDVPGDAQAGRWSMTAYGLQSQRLLVVTFYVTR